MGGAERRKVLGSELRCGLRSSVYKPGGTERLSGSVALPVGPPDRLADCFPGAACLGGSDSVASGGAACSGHAVRRPGRALLC